MSDAKHPTTDWRGLLVRYMAAIIGYHGVPFYGRSELLGFFSEHELQALDEIDLEARTVNMRDVSNG